MQAGDEIAGEEAVERSEQAVVTPSMPVLPPLIKASEAASRVVEPLFDPRPAVLGAHVVRGIESAGVVLARAEEAAAEIVARAQREAASLREAARQEGRIAAQEEALEALGRARAEYARLQSVSEADMLELAFGIARRVIGRVVELDPQIVAEIVRANLEHVRGRTRIVVVVHPDDLPALERRRAQFVAQVEGAAIYFDADVSVARGGCFIETESGRIDARLDVQLEAMRKALEES